MAHPTPDDLNGYALGALDPADERAVSEHLPDCERCSTELRERINPAVGVLAESVPQLEPPPELRERLLEIVRAEAEAGGAEAAAATAPRRRRRLRLGPVVLRPAAGLAALAVAGAGVAGYLANDGDDGGGSSTVPVTATGAGTGGSLVVAEDSAVMSVHGMPQLPKGAVYQIWVAEGSSVRPSSSFVPDPSGRGTAAVQESLPEGSQVLVTRESGPGHQAPTGVPLLSARVD